MKLTFLMIVYAAIPWTNGKKKKKKKRKKKGFTVIEGRVAFNIEF